MNELNIPQLLAQKRQQITELEAQTNRLHGAAAALGQIAGQIRSKYVVAAQKMKDADLEARWSDALKSAGGKVPDAVRTLLANAVGDVAKDIQATAAAQATEAVRTDGRRIAVEAFIAELAGGGSEPVPAPEPVPPAAPTSNGGADDAGSATGNGVQQ